MEAFFILIFGLPSLGFAALGVVLGGRRIGVLHSGISTEGRIVGWQEDHDGESPHIIWYYPIIRFTDRRGQTHDRRMNPGSTSRKGEVGDAYRLRYDPERPQRAYPANILTMMAGPVGFIVLGLGGIAVAWFIAGGG
jgi:hypothetical protein